MQIRLTSGNGKIYFHGSPDKHRDIYPCNVLGQFVIVESRYEDDNRCNAHTSIGVSSGGDTGRKGTRLLGFDLQGTKGKADIEPDFR